MVLYLPYWLYSRPQAGAGILPNLFNVSRMSHLFLMFGLFFVLLVALLVVLLTELRRAGRLSGRSLLRQGLPIWLGTMLFFPALTALILVPVILSPSIRTYIDDALANPEVQQVLGAADAGLSAAGRPAHPNGPAATAAQGNPHAGRAVDLFVSLAGDRRDPVLVCARGVQPCPAVGRARRPKLRPSRRRQALPLPCCSPLWG